MDMGAMRQRIAAASCPLFFSANRIRHAFFFGKFQLWFFVMTRGMHEDLDREEEVILASNRMFGLTMGGVFALFALWKALYWSPVFYVWAGLAVVFVASALWLPQVLAPFNKAWLKFGLLLHHAVNPLVMAILFYVVILPAGLTLRALGKDLLRLNWDKHTKTYWLPRTEVRPLSESMRQQF